MRASKRKHNQPPTPTPQARSQQTLVSIEATAWQGPLPDPGTLEEFERIVPGAAKAIVDEWRAETNHRRRFEQRALTFQGVEQIGGRLLAFAFAIAALGITAYLAELKAEWAAGILGAGTIGSVVLALISGRGK